MLMLFMGKSTISWFVWARNCCLIIWLVYLAAMFSHNAINWVCIIFIWVSLRKILAKSDFYTHPTVLWVKMAAWGSHRDKVGPRYLIGGGGVGLRQIKRKLQGESCPIFYWKILPKKKQSRANTCACRWTPSATWNLWRPKGFKCNGWYVLCSVKFN